MQVSLVHLCVASRDRTHDNAPGIVPSMTAASSARAASTLQTTQTTTSLSSLHNSPVGVAIVVMLEPGACPSHAHTILPVPKPPTRSLLMQPNTSQRCGAVISLLYRITHIACLSLPSCAIVWRVPLRMRSTLSSRPSTVLPMRPAFQQVKRIFVCSQVQTR